MALEPSIPLGIQTPKLPSGLELAQQLQALQAKRNENLLFDLENTAKQRVGEIFASPDVLRQDGTMDLDAARRKIFTDPHSQWLAPTMDRFLQERAQQEAKIVQERVQATLAVTSAISSELSPLLNRDDLTATDISKVASRIIVKFNGEPQVVRQVLSTLQSLPKGSEALKDWVAGEVMKAAAVEQRIAATYGLPTQVPRGDRVDITQTPTVGPRAGVPNVGGSLPTGMTPGDAATPQAMQDERGQTRLTTKGELAGAVREQGRGLPPGVPGSVVAGPVPGVPEQQVAGAQQFIKQTEALNESVAAADLANLNIQKMMQLSDNIATGRLSGIRTELAAFAEALHLPADIVGKIQGGLQDDSLPQAQEFMKLVWEQSLLRLRSQLPPGTQLTQAEWIRTAENNPNILMTKDAVLGIANYMQQVQRFLAEKRDFMGQWQEQNAGKPLNWTAADAAWREEAIKRGLLKMDDYKKPEKPFIYPPMLQGPEGALKLQQILDGMKPDSEVTLRHPTTGRLYKVRKTLDGAPVNVAN